MARVSQAHLDARRRQILEGAARCFARDGFHATSMQDVLRETGLSAGAVYRYFPSKEALIVDLAREVLDAVHGAFDQASRLPTPPPPGDILIDALTRVGRMVEHPASLVIQVWAETLRNPELDAVLQGFLGEVLAAWTRMVEIYQERGEIAADVPAEHVARTLIACCQGFLVQRALGHGDVTWLRDGLRGLMSGAWRYAPPTAG